MRRHRWWEDEVKDAVSSVRLNPGARLVVNTAELTLDFNANARYNGTGINEEFLGFTYQMKHRWAQSSEVEFHLHWFQNANNTPNWLIKWRTIANGFVASAWTSAIWTSNEFVYTAGNMLQYTEFAGVTPVVGLSGFFEVKLWRDTTNVSGLFPGADPYAGAASLKEADLHYQVDSLGSWSEGAKWGG
jgi:hypothetical protein